jgi:energy-coupling factor transporter ATP-binding protein EcfA2
MRSRPTIRGLDSVEMPERGNVLVVGANGSGKTTALLSLAGLIGEVESPLPGPVGLLLQDAEVGWGASTVLDEVVFGLGGDDAVVLDRARSVLAALELTPVETRDPRTLSAGEMQRVQLAAVLVRQPKSLLLDEPTAHLDPAHARELRAFVARMREGGVDLVVEATTDLERMDETDLVVVVHEREVTACGHPSSVLSGDVTRWGLVPNDAMEVASVWRRPITGTFASLATGDS